MLWQLCLSWCTVGDALFNRRGALELSSSFVSKNRKRLGKLLLCTFFGSIWKERNKRAYENCECSYQTVKRSFFVSILGLSQIAPWEW